jgi:hypothetical protein
MNQAKVFGFCAMLLLFEGVVVSNAEAGPLLDWLTGKNRKQADPQVAYMPGTQCESCTVTCQRQVVNYVPQTSYRTNWVQVPVTSYKPVATTDPCSGCTVTCMRPCTTYRWQAQRVPYTSYRPVYSTVTVQRPLNAMLSGTTGMPATAGCATCGVPAAPTAAPTAGVLTPGGSYLNTPAPAAYPGTTYPTATYPGASSPGVGVPSTGGSPFNASIPANNPPSLPSTNLQGNTTLRIPPAPTYDKSILTKPEATPSGDRLTPVPQAQPGVNSPITSGSSSASPIPAGPGIQPINDPAPNLRLQPPATPAPALLPPHDQTAQAPVRGHWDYNPIRLAHYEQAVPVARPMPVPAQTVTPAPAVQHGWKSLN